MAILGFLTNAAQNPPTALAQDITQLSPAKRCGIGVGSHPGVFKLTYNIAATGVTDLLYLIMLPLERFEEMTFTLIYQGHRAGEGYIYKTF